MNPPIEPEEQFSCPIGLGNRKSKVMLKNVVVAFDRKTVSRKPVTIEIKDIVPTATSRESIEYFKEQTNKKTSDDQLR